MNRRLRVIIGCCLTMLLAIIVIPARGQEVTDDLDPCVAAFRLQLAKEERLFRTVIEGQPPAAAAAPGAIRTDTAGITWVKVRTNDWRSATAAGMSDARMDASSEHPNRRGLVEVRGTLASESFVGPATQALRALRCRTAAVCEAARSADGTTSTTVTVQTPGCIPLTLQVPAECRFAGRATETARETALQTCNADRGAVLTLEADVLRMLGAYDAGHRALLQFAGMFDGFLDDVRAPLLSPMRDAVDMFRELRRIPCFLSECQ
jgi:hypothetical protein